MKTFKVLSIDAWAESENSWTWNNWFTQNWSYDETDYGPLTKESAMKFFKEFYINPKAEKRLEILDDQYNLVLVEKKNQRPLYAIEYGGMI